MEPFQLLDLTYVGSIIGATELVTGLTKKQEDHKQSRLYSVIVGLVLGVVFYFVANLEISHIVLNYFIATGFYSVVVKLIKNKLN